jgi:transaldolase
MKDHDTASVARSRLDENDPGFPLLLDSASVAEAREAADLAIVAGITTNPTLMARQGGSPVEQLQRLLDAFPGPIFYQPSATDPEPAETELLEARSLEPDRVVCKLPARRDFIALAYRLQASGTSTALTAVYSQGQALLATAAGIPWIIPYVNRAKRQAKNGDRLVIDLAEILRAARSRTRILAASIKSVDEVLRAVLEGAHAISAPLETLTQLGDHPLTESAIEEFAAHRGHRSRPVSDRKVAE